MQLISNVYEKYWGLFDVLSAMSHLLVFIIDIASLVFLFCRYGWRVSRVSSCILDKSQSKFTATHCLKSYILFDIYMGTNMAAGNQQKHLSLSFATKA